LIISGNVGLFARSACQHLEISDAIKGEVSEEIIGLTPLITGKMEFIHSLIRDYLKCYEILFNRWELAI